MNISDLLQGCRDMNRKAQNELYHTYADKVMNIARRYTRDISEAKDVVQNTFLKVFNQLDKYDSDKGAFHSWITRITINEALLIKRRDKKYVYPEDAGDIFEEVKEATVFSTIGIGEIKKIIDELPEGYKIIFNLFVVEGFNHKEIAELLSISVVTSRTQLLRARKAIQKKMLKNENLQNNQVGKAI